MNDRVPIRDFLRSTGSKVEGKKISARTWLRELHMRIFCRPNYGRMSKLGVAIGSGRIINRSGQIRVGSENSKPKPDLFIKQVKYLNLNLIWLINRLPDPTRLTSLSICIINSLLSYSIKNQRYINNQKVTNTENIKEGKIKKTYSYRRLRFRYLVFTLQQTTVQLNQNNNNRLPSRPSKILAVRNSWISKKKF